MQLPAPTCSRHTQTQDCGSEKIKGANRSQQLYTRPSPRILKAPRDIAIIPSAESSNRIEGVSVAHDRLKPLVLGLARLRDRSEEEVMG